MLVTDDLKHFNGITELSAMPTYIRIYEGPAYKSGTDTEV
jgi:hypothetical protein